MKAAVSTLRSTGRRNVADALEKLVEAIGNDRDHDRTFRDQLHEQVEFLAQQMVLPDDRRKRGLIKAVLMALDAATRTAPNVWKRWQTLRPSLSDVFGRDWD